MTLFRALSRYASSSTVRPLENFSTELLAWAINKSPRLAADVVSFLLGAHDSRRPKSVDAKTQRWLGADGFADIALTIRFVEGGELIILLENKIQADIGGREPDEEDAFEPGATDRNRDRTQIDNYLRFAATKKNVRVALLSKRWEPERPKWLTPQWLGVHRWRDVAECITGVVGDADPVDSFVFSEFHKFLLEAGMTLQPVRELVIEGAKQRLHLLRLFEEAAKEVAVKLKSKGVVYRGSDARRLGLWAYWLRGDEDLAGIAFSDTVGDTALCVYGNLGDRVFARLVGHPLLQGLQPAKSGRFWGEAYVPLIDMSKGFFALTARDQMATLTERCCSLLTAILDVLDNAEGGA